MAEVAELFKQPKPKAAPPSFGEAIAATVKPAAVDKPKKSSMPTIIPAPEGERDRPVNPKPEPPAPTNEQRAEIAKKALAVGLREWHTPEDLATSILDLVANLLHLAHQNDIEPDYIIRMAQMHYDAEVKEEAAATEKAQA